MKTTSKFPNVTKAMSEKGYTIEKLAGEIGIGRCALSEKLAGKYKFTFEEVLLIRDIIAPGANIEYLFRKIV